MGGFILGLLHGIEANALNHYSEKKVENDSQKHIKETEEHETTVQHGITPDQFREMLQTTIIITEASLAELNAMKNDEDGKLCSADIIPLFFNTEKIGAAAVDSDLYNFYRMYLIFTTNGSREYRPKKKICTSYKAVRKHVDDMIETAQPFNCKRFLRDLDHLNFEEYSAERAAALEEAKEKAKTLPINSIS